MCDLFLVLAQAPGGLSCFLVPRVLPDGTRNTFRIQRLKDKLGNRSNASSEPEFDGTLAWLVGGEGQGVRTIIEMVSMTRLDCVIGSASGMRAALVQAIHHAKHRRMFGQTLADFQLTQAKLGEMAALIDSAALLTYRAAWMRDDAEQRGAPAVGDVSAAAAMAKMCATENASRVIDMALQMHGGLGVKVGTKIESLYRDIRSLRIYEGATEVQQLIIGKSVLRG
jgi:alkylation response protein AidB-like acyl-CoA dehydrogenase